MTVKFIIALVIAYALGNLSPSTIMAKARGIDIKKEGSGNAGTTNALRVMGKKAGLITALVDVFKGTVAVLIGILLVGRDPAGWCILAVFLGCFPGSAGIQRRQRCCDHIRCSSRIQPDYGPYCTCGCGNRCIHYQENVSRFAGGSIILPGSVIFHGAAAYARGNNNVCDYYS